MVPHDCERFNEFAKSCGNRYVAVKMIAQWARQLSNELKEYKIPESKLIEMVLNGKYYSDSELERRKIANDDDNIFQVIEWVTDKEVIDEVKRVYGQSIRHKHLMKCNNQHISPGKQSRVNILLKMIWYSTNS